MHEQLVKELHNNIVNFYCNIFGFNRILLKKLSKKPIINVYEGSFLFTLCK